MCRFGAAAAGGGLGSQKLQGAPRGPDGVPSISRCVTRVVCGATKACKPPLIQLTSHAEAMLCCSRAPAVPAATQRNKLSFADAAGSRHLPTCPLSWRSQPHEHCPACRRSSLSACGPSARRHGRRRGGEGRATRRQRQRRRQRSCCWAPVRWCCRPCPSLKPTSCRPSRSGTTTRSCSWGECGCRRPPARLLSVGRWSRMRANAPHSSCWQHLQV